MGWFQGQQLKGHRSELQYLHVRAGETHQEPALQEGQFATRGGTCPGSPALWGRWDQRRKRGSCERLSEEQGTLHGAHGKETLQASGAQAAGILLSFRLSTSRHSGVPLLHGTSPGIKKGMNLKTKSEMLFPGREKSGLVTPNSTDCAIPKGLGGA